MEIRFVPQRKFGCTVTGDGGGGEAGEVVGGEAAAHGGGRGGEGLKELVRVGGMAEEGVLPSS